MDLQTRLEILNSSKAITDCTKEVMLNVIQMFKKIHEIELTEENGAMLITHLSMAIMRVKNNEPVKTIDEDVFKETLESEHIEKANLIYEDLSKVLDVTLPENEKKYMLVNICVILENI
ncbi:PRD domain-containing protein [Fusobacterium sp.]|uniref:PRD domain-containing protein n=1 Tax=Fusobacterium sp. TaxID=68766 RepID=UPI0028FF4C37|nr:PRD domain-containing protein [Fusobacterium sp.]MDU1912437.1 PRD domain-containing protein [Fusobacterium sp.]